MDKVTVLLDRDGVINKDVGHLDSFKKIKFLKGVFQAFKFLKKKYKSNCYYKSICSWKRNNKFKKT